MLDFPANIINNPRRAGALAAQRQFFCGSRYCVAPVHTRFDAITWFVWDALKLDDGGYPSIIRQEETLEAAIAASNMTDASFCPFHREGGEAYAYPMSGGRIAWGYNDSATGWCTARGIREFNQ